MNSKTKEWAQLAHHLLGTLPSNIATRKELLESFIAVAPDGEVKQAVLLTKLGLVAHEKAISEAQQALPLLTKTTLP